MVQESGDHQLRPGEYPIFYRVSKIAGGDRQISEHHQQYVKPQ